MKKYTLFLALVLTTLISQSQITVNANSVIGFSSEFSPTDWSAAQTTGAPTIVGCADLPTAWASVTQDGQREYLELGIPVLNAATQIRIFENLAPGSIDTVYVRNVSTGLWVEVFQTTATPLTCPNIFTVNFAALGYTIDAVRIAMNSPAIPDWNEIDGIEVTGLAVLSVNLTNFTGSVENDMPVLNWTTESEKNIEKFEILYSADGKNFSTAGTVAAKNLPGTNLYKFTDVAARTSSVGYYRLKIIEINQPVRYSSIIKLDKNPNTAISIYPVPAKDFITLSGISSFKQIQLLSLEGKLVTSWYNSAIAARLSISNIPAGTYLLRLTGNNATETRKITVVK